MAKRSYYHTSNYFKNNGFRDWDPNRFDWDMDSWKLAANCSRYINIWWDPNRFNWIHHRYLIQTCSKDFKLWWVPSKVDQHHNSFELLKHCSEYVKIWWDPDKFDWGYEYGLSKYCLKYKSIWYKDYIIYKLLQ